MLASRMRMAAGVSVVGGDWYLSGGAPTPIAVYNVREGGSLAGSKVNVVNPGTFDAAAGVDPSWSGTTGWGFDGLTTYLTTGIVPAGNYTFLYRFSDVTIAGRFMMGVTDGSPTNRFFVQPFISNGTAVVYSNVQGGDNTFVSPGLSTGVMSMAGTACYRNGVQEGVVPGTAANTQDIYLGAYNTNGSVGAFGVGSIQYVAIWDTSTGHAAWMPAVSDAVAAL